MFQHLTADIETMGKSSTAPLVAIGAQMFNPNTGGFGESFYEIVTLESAMRYGDADADTIQFWVEQAMKDPSSAKAWLRKGTTLEVVLANFSQWLQAQRNALGLSKYNKPIPLKPWGCGKVFDFPILEHACRQIGSKELFPFWDYQDYRTLITLARAAGFRDRDVAFEGVKHTALDDSRHEAKVISLAWQHVRDGREWIL